MNTIKLSKFLSFILRHHPEKFELKLDKKGFVAIDKLVNVIRQKFPNVTKETILQLVNSQEKKRFEIVNDKIRAIYGHSIKVDLGLPETEPPEFLYHGTSRKVVKQILTTGLKPMSRQYVHLSSTNEDAYKVGLRHDKNPVILKIRAKDAYKEGIKFYKTLDNIFLTKEIPPKFIEI